MDQLNIKSTDRTPAFFFDQKLNSLNISGNATMDHPGELFDGVFEWVDKNINSGISLNIELKYLNDESSKTLMGLIYKLQKLEQKNKALVVNWRYEKGDGAWLDVGETMSDMLGIKFTYTPI